jgi:ABC-type sugar transport systems, ATPase components
MAFLEIDNLKKRYGAVEILKGINLDLDKGGFLVLVGPSGLRQVHLAQHHRGAGEHLRRADPG